MGFSRFLSPIYSPAFNTLRLTITWLSMSVNSMSVKKGLFLYPARMGGKPFKTSAFNLLIGWGG